MIKNFGGLIFSLLFNSTGLSAARGSIATSTLNITTAAAELDTIYPTTVNQSVNQFSTELIAQMAGGPVLFDQTFNAAYSDPMVKAAVAQAAGVLTGAGATSITGPTQTSYSQTLVNSSSVTVTNSTTDNIIDQATDWVGPQTVLVGNYGVVQGYTLQPVGSIAGLGAASPPVVLQGTDPISAGNNVIIPTGGNPLQSFILLTGQEDINVLEFSFVDIDQTTTNTDTYLTTTVYDMVGSVVPVPEPSSALVLGLGGIAFALYRWRVARAAGAARPKSTEKTH